MPAPSPDTALEACAFALGRLHAMTEDHPWAAAWRTRSTVDAVLAWALEDSYLLDKPRVLARLAGAPHRAVRDDGREIAAASWIALALELDDSLVRPEHRAEFERARAWLGYSRGRTPLDAALRGLRRALVRGRCDGAAARCAFAERLQTGGLAPLPFPALAPARLGRHEAVGGAAGSREAGYGDRAVLAVEARAAAEAAVAGFATLCAGMERLRRRLGPRRRQSRLGDALDALAGAVALSPAGLGRTLGASPRGAAMLLDELVEGDAAIEVTGRRAWTLYTLADADGQELAGAVVAWRETFWRAGRLAQARRVRPGRDRHGGAVGRHDPCAHPGDGLDGALAEVDAALAAMPVPPETDA